MCAGRRLEDLMLYLSSRQIDYSFVAIPASGRIITGEMSSAMQQAYAQSDDVNFKVRCCWRHPAHIYAGKQSVSGH